MYKEYQDWSIVQRGADHALWYCSNGVTIVDANGVRKTITGPNDVAVIEEKIPAWSL